MTRKRCCHEGCTDGIVRGGVFVSRMEQKLNDAALKDVRCKLKREEFVAYNAQKVVVSTQTIFQRFNKRCCSSSRSTPSIN